MNKHGKEPIGSLDYSDAWHQRNAESAKVGTIPMLIIRDRRKKAVVGARIKFRKAERWSPWMPGIVTATEPVLFISLA